MPLHSLCTLPDDLLLDGIFRHLEPRQLVRLRLVRPLSPNTTPSLSVS
jgi:hypothetical protein